MPHMTWKEYKESLKRGAPTPNMLRAFLLCCVIVLPIRLGTQRIVDRLGITGELPLTLLSIFHGLLTAIVIFVLVRIFPPYGNKKRPSPGG